VPAGMVTAAGATLKDGGVSKSSTKKLEALA
jgi:hypothetical protein